MSQRDGTNYYEILEVPPDASPSEIQKAYQRAKQTYSVDNPALYSMFSQDEARELLRMIDEAYAVLSNSSQRRAYDESIAAGGKTPPPAARVVEPFAPHPEAKTPPPVEHKTTMSPAMSTAASSAPPIIGAGAGNTSVSESYTVRKKELSDAPPAGTGKTQLSSFKIDENFENEIASATEFDGAMLQRIRLYKNVTIDRLSEATRISRPYLMAVETNDYKSLPAAVFVRGFIVQVAKLLSLDENKVASSYMKLFKAGGGK